MWQRIALTFLIAVSGTASAVKHRSAPIPTQVEIARHTFIDVGPPNDYYEVFIIHSVGTGTEVERITLTPSGNICLQPATVETASASISRPVSELFAGTNPCAIPEKDLHKELERRKKYLVFSGADVAMRVQCGGQTRIIRADILDRDMFDRHPDTPQHTSWTMQLLQRLDDALGPGVLEKPIFPLTPVDDPSKVDSSAHNIQAVAAGNYDDLFHGAPDKPSDLYKAAQVRPPPPGVRLLHSDPVEPLEFIGPKYPPMARLANVSSQVTATLIIGSAGDATNVVFKSGSPLLRGATEEAVRNWKFPTSAAGQSVETVIEFNTNCKRE